MKRLYCEIPVSAFNEVQILEAIRTSLKELTNPKIYETNVVYFEGCYLSEKVFNTFTRTCWSISRNECLWRPASMHPLMTMIFEKQRFQDGVFYQVKILNEGSLATAFTAVSRVEDFFFIFEGEDKSCMYSHTLPNTNKED